MSFNPQFEKIGDILVYEKIITQDDLDQALIEKKKSNEKLGQILINKKIITEAQLVVAKEIAEQISEFFLAFSKLVPESTVIKFLLVILSDTFKDKFVSNLISLFVRIPTSLPLSTTGTPDIL